LDCSVSSGFKGEMRLSKRVVVTISALKLARIA
jgi:hypothetical protein